MVWMEASPALHRDPFKSMRKRPLILEVPIPFISLSLAEGGGAKGVDLKGGEGSLY